MQSKQRFGMFLLSGLWLSLLIMTPSPSLAWVIPTGPFGTHQTSAVQTYLQHLTAVQQASDKLLTAFVNDDPASDIADFLYEWERLVFFRDTSPDYQLQEFCAEPHVYNTQTMAMATVLVPFCRKLEQQLRDPKHNKIKMVQMEAAPGKPKRKIVDDDLLELQRLCDDTNLPPGAVQTQVTAKPFRPLALHAQPETIRLQIQQLQKDHNKLLDQGSDFGSLIPCQQKEYLRKLRVIEDQWQVACTRLAWTNSMNTAYLEQCDSLLQAVGLSEFEYQQLHAKTIGAGPPAPSCGMLLVDDTTTTRNTLQVVAAAEPQIIVEDGFENVFQ